MKKSLSLFLSLLCMAFMTGLMLVGCQDEPEQPVSLKLHTDVTSVALPSGGGDVTIDVTSPDVITATSTQSWCTLSVGERSTSGITVVTVHADKNTGTEARSALLDISCGDAGLSVRVTQDNCSVAFSVSGGPFAFDEKGGTATFTVVSTRQPEVTVTEGGWCQVATTDIDATHTTTVTLMATRNFMPSARKGTIVVRCDGDSTAVTASQTAWTAPETAATSTVTPEEMTDRLGMGWNMGNHFDAHSGGKGCETGWGNPLCTQATFDAVRAAGFTSVRIPVTYLDQIGPAPDYTINPDWLARIVEVIGYAQNAGLNVITNIHHDGADSEYWLNIKEAAHDPQACERIGDKFGTVWTQIAEALKDKGDDVIFEPFNEIQDGEWGYGENLTDGGTQYRIINEWNQLFVNAVRATGGNNATRWLAAVGMCASPSLTFEHLELPKDYTTANRRMVGVHFYDPSPYTLETTYAEWGHTGSLSKSPSWGKEDHVREFFDTFSTQYKSQNIPVYVGESGCSFRTEERDIAFHKYYMEYVYRAAALARIPIFVWDNGAEGGGKESHAYLRHDNGAYIAYSKEVIDLMREATFSTDPDYTLQSVWDRAPEKIVSEDDAKLAEYLGYLCGTSSRDWTWDDSEFITSADYNGDVTGPCWGNAGFLGATAEEVYGNGTQIWWGVNSDGLSEQVKGYNDNVKYPDSYAHYSDRDGKGAVMTFTLDGLTLTKSSGSGTFALSMAEGRAQASGSGLWSIGMLTTTGDGILFPCQINTGVKCENFDVMRLDDRHLMLTYASETTAAWEEATYWRFRRK